MTYLRWVKNLIVSLFVDLFVSSNKRKANSMWFTALFFCDYIYRGFIVQLNTLVSKYSPGNKIYKLISQFTLLLFSYFLISMSGVVFFAVIESWLLFVRWEFKGTDYLGNYWVKIITKKRTAANYSTSNGIGAGVTSVVSFNIQNSEVVR